MNADINENTGQNSVKEEREGGGGGGGGGRGEEEGGGVGGGEGGSERKEEEEREKEDELLGKRKKYLLNDRQFSKFSHLLEKKSNLDFIEKLKSTPLIHAQRFYPISEKEYGTIIDYVKSILEEKGKKIKSDAEITKTNDLVSTTSSLESDKPLLINPNNKIAAVPNTVSAPAPAPAPATSLDSSMPVVKETRPKALAKTNIWKPETWLAYRPKSKKDG